MVGVQNSFVACKSDLRLYVQTNTNNLFALVFKNIRKTTEK